jgi:tetratricopeptide (TPR) repeat protein
MPCREWFPFTNTRTAGTLLFLLCAGLLQSAGIDLQRTEQRYLEGDYNGCINDCETALAEKLRLDEWPLLLARSQMALGRYPDAKRTLTDAIERNSGSIRLRLLARDVFRANGDAEAADEQLAQINELGGSRIWNYRDPPNMVVLGRAALLLGADPKLVLDRFFDAARKADPDHRDAWLAAGELALDKHDYELAARLYGDAAKNFPNDPDVHFGHARAFAPSDSARMGAALQTALALNPRHAPSLLLLVDRAVDGENYEAARQLLNEVLQVNPWHPEAWAYHAVLHHLESDSQAEREARAKALHFWETNPAVDHLIGRKLSQNYRFREGAARQRQALEFDPDYLPAHKQYAQDLLRLGESDLGWQLARAIHERDAYDVTAYNLVTLHDTLSQFDTLTRGNLKVRMSPREAALYGNRVLDLLDRANHLLTNKYQVTLDEPVIIEIFPNQKDFAVRTFGMPHNPGFLGVCFGRVVTANSPAAQPHPVNWEAVLWHEFAHVITLHLTRNKMPRWLSEGLSVYEERQANPSWGQHVNPRYREMLLSEDLTPVGELSAAFLSPKSDLHLQFAYYQSSLVVEFIIERFGWNVMLDILRDLGHGTPINTALTIHTIPLVDLESAFVTHARNLAHNMAPGLDWTRPPGFNAQSGDRRGRRPAPDAFPGDLLTAPVPATPDSPEVWSEDRLSTNYWALRRTAEQALRDARWDEAKEALHSLVDLHPNQRGPDNAHTLLAQVYRILDDTDRERESLARSAALDHQAVDDYLRLMELAEAAGDWPDVATNANRFLAVNPLLARPYLYLAKASEHTGAIDTAILAWQRVLLLNPPDPAQAHYQLARLLHQQGLPSAHRHVLQSLEEAPRFRDAHRLLLDLNRASPESERARPPETSPASNP